MKNIFENKRFKWGVVLFFIFSFQVTGILIGMLDVIPSGVHYQVIIIVGVNFIALIVLISVTFSICNDSDKKKRYLKCFFVSLITVIWCGFILAISLLLYSKDSFVAGRSLITTLDYKKYNKMIFIYEYDGVPDGFEKSFLMVKDGWLPIMKYLVSVPVRIGNIQKKSNIVEFHLNGYPNIDNDDILFFDLTNGNYWIDKMKSVK